MTNQLFLKPNEGKFLALATVALIEQLNKSSQNVLINWNPETRKNMREIIEAGKSLSIKLRKLGFDMSGLPPFIEATRMSF